MLRPAIFGLLLAGVFVCSQSVPAPAQVLKGGPKDAREVPKKAGDKEEKIEWPKSLGGKSLSEWAHLMHDSKDASTREQAIRILPAFGPDARKAASANLLVAIQKEPDMNVRVAAIQTVPLLGFDGPDEMKKGINALITAINPANGHPSHVRHEALMALGNCGPFARDAIPVIINFPLKDTTAWHNRKAAVYALGRVGVPMSELMKKELEKARAKEKEKERELEPVRPKDKEPLPKKGPAVTPPQVEEEGPDVRAVNALSNVLEIDTAHDVRREAITSLILLGPPHIESAWRAERKALTGAMKDRNHSIAIWARVAFIRTEQDLIKASDPNLKALTDLLSSAEAEVRLEALQAFGTLGNEAKSRVADIIALATTTSDKDEDLMMAAMAIWALSQMNEEAGKILPVIDPLRRHKKELIKNAADQAYKVLTQNPKEPEVDPKAKPPKK
jgi:HEAT repeat protein